jgi:hypothetical protein
MTEVMEDVKANHNGEDRNAVERILLKLFGQNKERDERSEMSSKFWSEFDEFKFKLGPYANRKNIWLSTDLKDRLSHIWHNRKSARRF